MPRILTIVLLALLLAGCSAQGQLASRAADYYSFMAGYNQKAKYTSYLSPAFRHTLKKEALDVYNTAIKANAAGTPRYPQAKPDDIATRIEGRFAMTVANPTLGGLYVQQGNTKWVKVGTKWYLYLASDAEREKYGAFPVGMLPPKYVGRPVKEVTPKPPKVTAKPKTQAKPKTEPPPSKAGKGKGQGK